MHSHCKENGFWYLFKIERNVHYIYLNIIADYDCLKELVQVIIISLLNDLYQV